MTTTTRTSSSSSTLPATQAPLTTTFTPPPGCLGALLLNAAEGDTIVFLSPYGQAIFVYPRSQCYPPGFWGYITESSGTVGGDGKRSTFVAPYSPGLACPAGYTTAPGTTIVSGTTTMACCPSAFSRHSDYGYCVSFGSVWTWTSPTDRTETSTYAGALIMSDVALAWQESDLASPSISTTQSVKGGVSDEDSPASAPGDRRPSLSTGATIGVAIGAAAALVLILSAAIHLFKRRRARRIAASEPRGESGELRDFFMRRKRRSRQVAVDTTGLHEVEDKPKPAEADDMNVRAELEGDWRGNEMQAVPSLPQGQKAEQ